MSLAATIVFPDISLCRSAMYEECEYTESRSVIFRAAQQSAEQVEFVFDRVNALRCDATELLDPEGLMIDGGHFDTLVEINHSPWIESMKRVFPNTEEYWKPVRHYVIYNHDYIWQIVAAAVRMRLLE